MMNHYISIRGTKQPGPSPGVTAIVSVAMKSHSFSFGELTLTVTVGQHVLESGARIDVVIVAIEACEVPYDAYIFIVSAVIVVVVIVIAVAFFFRFAL